MKETELRMTLTNGLVFEGVSDYIGSASVCINVRNIGAEAMDALYKLDATVRGYDYYWQIQIAKSHISDIQFLATN